MPATMRALELRSYDLKPSLQLVEKPIPQLRRGEVLVRIHAAPINPSDLMFLRGLYGVRRKLPVVPGFEASGVVEKAGGIIARALVGRRVACAASDEGDGTWAEYITTRWNRCFPLLRGVSMEEGATLLVNPMSALALMKLARRAEHRVVVQTAAASALGQMLARLSQRFGVQMIHIVYRREQVELLRRLGGEYVLNSSEPQFDEQFKELARRLRAQLAFDAVAGDMTGRILRGMPRGARVLVYGAVSQAACRVDPAEFIFKEKRVEGFWLPLWFRKQNPLRQLQLGWQVQTLAQHELKTEIRERVPLERANAAIEEYATKMTGGKILLMPSLPPT